MFQNAFSVQYQNQFYQLYNFFQKMFLEIFLTSLLILIVLFINSCWIKPRKTIKFYETQLKNMSYNAKIIPHRMLYNYFLQKFEEGTKKGDPQLYQKIQLPMYDIVVTNVTNKILIQFGHIDFLKDYFSVDKHYDFPKYPLLVGPFISIFGKKATGLTQGNVWKRKRPILNKLFNFNFVKKQIPNIIQVCDQCIKYMEEKAKKGEDQSGRYVQCNLLHDLLLGIFSSIIFSGFLGIKNREQIDGIQVSQYLANLMDDVGLYRLKSPTILLGHRFYDLQLRKIDKDINQRKRKLDEWGKKIIKKQIQKLKKQKIQKNDQIQMDGLTKAYLIYMKQNNIPDHEFNDDDIFQDFLGIFFGGTDTTTYFLYVMLCYIAKNPQIQKQLRNQIKNQLKDDDYSYENLKNFKYIEALQKQTTRFYGPSGSNFVRQALNDSYINGLAIKKGTLVSTNWRANHYSEKYFKEPLKFRPQRWLNGECDNLDQFVLLGFSAGARTCIGKHLAIIESKVALIKIMKRYKKITLGKSDFKWEAKLMVSPQYFETKLTIDEESERK